MIVMDLKMDNFLSFRHFHMNMSYPKKIVGSFIENENLKNRANFRYKKINVIMGANASGKTSIGKMMMDIFNFMDKKQSSYITDVIGDTSKEASFSIDFVTSEYLLYRVEATISPRSGDKYEMNDIDVCVRNIPIGTRDSYETCIKKLSDQETEKCPTFIEELGKIKGLSWIFAYPADSSDDAEDVYTGKNGDSHYVHILNNILKTLDPAIIKVEKIESVEKTYVIRYANDNVVIQDGKSIENSILSSGTRAGITIASMITSMLDGVYGFYYCDEKFSYIHSDIEKAVLSIMVSRIKDDEQLFFTTHNTNILDLPLPKHSFTFLKKDIYNEYEPIKCITASSLLKRNTDSLKSAVENDLFSVAPNIDLIYDLANDEEEN